MKPQDMIKVKYKNVDGYHVFTSGSHLTKGLCAGSTDPQSAFNEVAKQIEYLLKKNHKIDCVCEPVTSFAEFKAWVDHVLSGPVGHIKTVPTAVIEYSKSKSSVAA